MSISEFFCQTGKKAGTTTECNYLGPIGADFAWKKVLLYEIDDEEVI